jgi:eukaryotic-like serine/threonine-protein kinase
MIKGTSMEESSDEPTPSLDLSPPSASRGDQVMQARIAERLFGETSARPRVAHYEILRRVGAGGMGVVYAAHDTQLDRTVALKQVRRTRLTVRDRERLLSEARALAKLSHPNVVHVYEVGEHEGDVYIAMEFVDGETLAQWQRTPRSIAAIVEVYVAAATGLRAAHEAGLIHRDFKPSNVLVGGDGRVRVVDFGLADLAAGEGASTRSGSGSSETTGDRRVAGTPGYIAPEILDGAPATRASDLYSVCVALWEAVTSELPPLVHGTRGRRWPGPRWLEQVLRRGLDRDPSQRWPSLAALIHELERRPKRRRVRAIAGASLALVSAAALGLVWAFELAPPQICVAPQAQFDEVWGDARREQLRARLRATPLPEPERTVELVSEALEQFGRSWVAGRVEACSGSSARFDEIHQCLDRSLATAGALLETIEHGDLSVHARIASLLAELGDPSRCVRALGPTLPPAALRSQVETDRRTLDHARLRLAAGRLDEAERGLARLRESDAVQGFAPLRAEFALVRGRLLMARQEPEAALDALVEAAVLAEREQLGPILFEARREVVAIEVRVFERPSAARRWLAMTSAAAENLDDSLVRAELLEARAEVEELAGELGPAEATLAEAVALAAAAEDPVAGRHLRIRLANVIAEAGRSDEALDAYAALEAEWAGDLGPEHPALGSVHFNIGLALVDLGQTADARRHLEAALRIQEATYGPTSPQLAPVLTMLADTANAEARYADAIALAERAATMQSQALPPGHSERGTALMALGWAQIQTGLLADALVTHERLALATEGQLTPENAAYLQQTLGWLRCRVDACVGAKPHFELARATGDETTQLQAGLGLANVELAEGRASGALEALERLLPKVEALSLEEAPEALAFTRWMLARALVDSGVSRASPRVQELARASAAAYQSLAQRPDVAEDLDSLILPSNTK